MFMTFIIISGITGFYHSKKILSKTDKMDYLLKARFTIVFVVLGVLIHILRPSIREYTFFFVVIFNCSKITILCQLSHVTKREFQPIRFINLAIAVLFLLCLVFAIFQAEPNEMKHTVFALSALDFINFAVMVTHRLSWLLSIKVFKVKKSNAPQAGTAVAELPQSTGESQEFKKEATNDSSPYDNL